MSAHAEALDKANALASSGDDSGALPLYDSAVESFGSSEVESADAVATHPLARRALCKERLFDASGALADLEALSRGAGHPLPGPVALCRARCLFETGKFAEAMGAFDEAASAGADAAACERGKRKCSANLSESGAAVTERPAAAAKGKEEAPGSGKNAGSAASAAASAAGGSSALKLPRFSHYQSDKTVTVDVFVRGTAEADVTVEATESTLVFRHASCAPLEVSLFGAVDPAALEWSCRQPKVEIRLKKKSPALWASLERPAGASVAGAAGAALPNTLQDADEDFRPSYPSSSAKKKNWDAIDSQIAQEEEQDKPEGEDALNKLLQGIYANASEETKRAMNKSYVESGGTVLSTNWSEVGKEEVKGTPPKGMEMRKWGTDEVVARDTDDLPVLGEAKK